MENIRGKNKTQQLMEGNGEREKVAGGVETDGERVWKQIGANAETDI